MIIDCILDMNNWSYYQILIKLKWDWWSKTDIVLPFGNEF